MMGEVRFEGNSALGRVRLLLAVLMTAVAIPSFSEATEQRAMRDALTETRPWPAPTGHRQPRTANVPPSLEELSGSDEHPYATLVASSGSAGVVDVQRGMYAG